MLCLALCALRYAGGPRSFPGPCGRRSGPPAVRLKYRLPNAPVAVLMALSARGNHDHVAGLGRKFARIRRRECPECQSPSRPTDQRSGPHSARQNRVEAAATSAAALSPAPTTGTTRDPDAGASPGCAAFQTRSPIVLPSGRMTAAARPRRRTRPAISEATMSRSRARSSSPGPNSIRES